MNNRQIDSMMDGLPDLPARTFTKDRQIVETRETVWRIRASSDGGELHKLDWSFITDAAGASQISARALRIFQLYLVQRLSFCKGTTVRNDFWSMLRMLRWLSSGNGSLRKPLSWDDLSFNTFRAFLEDCMKGNDRGNDFARMRDFYVWGAFGGRYSDFDPHLALGLKAIRAQGNVKGEAVRFGHITRGPLSVAEREEIVRALDAQRGSPEVRVIIMIHLELGANPNAVARLKNSDLRKFETKAVERGRSSILKRFQLEVPRVKKRTEFRQTKARPISLKLGEALESLQRGGPDDPLFPWLNRDSPERSIGRLMDAWVENEHIVSPRTGQLLNLSPRRFRYTLGTEAAREGASPATIAQLLDHSDLQNVNVYVEASSYVVDQVGSRFDDLFAPVASQFRGEILDRENGAISHRDAQNVIPSASSHLPLVNLGGIGMCGRDVRTDGLCNLAPPLTCYACEFFAAFRHGPHREVLNSLVNIRESMATASDVRIPMQIDGVIAAARQLVSQIEGEAKDGRSGE